MYTYKYNTVCIISCINTHGSSPTDDYLCRYDLHEKNLAIIHCPSGHPSTGILIACLLKYIGAFNKSEDAYDFYCTKR